jgi:hypothetical protein
MPAHRARVLARLLAVLLLVSLTIFPAQTIQAAPPSHPRDQESVPPQAALSAQTRPQKPPTTRSRASPLKLSLTATPADHQTAIVSLTLTAPVAFDDINLQLSMSSGITLVSSTVPTHTMLTALG